MESVRREPAMREFATARGRRAAIELADGTRIVLSVDSKLRVPADYGEMLRAVYLEGEAYFAIAHDAAKPFAVHAGQGVIWDLGTRFGVRAYADEQDVEVVVADGKVRVRAAGSRDSAGQVVSEGELSRLDHTGVPSLPRRVDTRRYLAWTAGRLAFQDTPLGVVLPQLARWDDVDFTLGARRSRRCGARFRSISRTRASSRRSGRSGGAAGSRSRMAMTCSEPGSACRSRRSRLRCRMR